MHRAITILECPSNLGLKQLVPGREPGVRRLPETLRKHGLHAGLGWPETVRIEPPLYRMDVDPESGVRNADLIAGYAIRQANELSQLIASARFPLVLGGDCSILIGNVLGLKESGRYGLFFLDGHTDFMMPGLSQTGGAAGMDLFIVTGHAHRKLADIDGKGPYVREEHVWCIGNRELDEDYVQPILDSKIHYRDLHMLRVEGMAGCVNQFLDMISNEGLDGFWIHLDLDVLDNEIMPAVDSPQPDGLSYAELREILLPLLASPLVTGLQLTILDPDLDPDGSYTRPLVRELCSLLLQ